MGDVSKRTKLILEARDVSGFSAGECFEGYYFIGLAIIGFIDHTHAAGAEAATNSESVCSYEISSGVRHYWLNADEDVRHIKENPGKA